MNVRMGSEFQITLLKATDEDIINDLAELIKHISRLCLYKIDNLTNKDLTLGSKLGFAVIALVLINELTKRNALPDAIRMYQEQKKLYKPVDNKPSVNMNNEDVKKNSDFYKHFLNKKFELNKLILQFSPNVKAIQEYKLDNERQHQERQNQNKDVELTNPVVFKVIDIKNLPSIASVKQILNAQEETLKQQKDKKDNIIITPIVNLPPRTKNLKSVTENKKINISQYRLSISEDIKAIQEKKGVNTEGPQGIPSAWKIKNEVELLNINCFEFLYYVALAIPNNFFNDLKFIEQHHTIKNTRSEVWSTDIWEKLHSMINPPVYNPNFNYAQLYTNFLFYLENNIAIIYQLCSELDERKDTAFNLNKLTYKMTLYFMLDAIYQNPCKALERSAEMVRDILRGKNIKESEALVTERLTKAGKTATERKKQQLLSLFATSTPSKENSTIKSIENVYSDNVHTMMVTSMPTARLYRYHLFMDVLEFRWGMQIKVENKSASIYNLFDTWLTLKEQFSPDIIDQKHTHPTISHIYFNLLVYGWPDTSNIKKVRAMEEKFRSHVLHTIEDVHPNIAVISLPADGGFLNKEMLKNIGEYSSWGEVRNKMLDALINAGPLVYENTIRDFHVSDEIYKTLYSDDNLKKFCNRNHITYPIDGPNETVCLTILLDKSLQALGFTSTQKLSSADQQAIFFHLAKFELPNFIIHSLQPTSINFSCRDAIDRGGVASLYFNLIESIQLKQPLSEKEFFTGLYGASTMVKGRGINRHINMFLNCIDVYINNQDRNGLSANIPCWLRSWRDNNIDLLPPIQEQRQESRKLAKEEIDFSLPQYQSELNYAIITMESHQKSTTFNISEKSFILTKRKGKNIHTNRIYYDIIDQSDLIGESKNKIFNCVACVEKLEDDRLLIFPSNLVAKAYPVKNNELALENLAMINLSFTRIKNPIIDPKEGKESFLLFQKWPGQTLAQVIINLRHEYHPQSREYNFIVLSLIREILYSLKELHTEYKTIHCDIKPDNIMVDMSNPSKPIVHLIDFGLSRPNKEIPSGALFGTSGYMDPEMHFAKEKKSRLSPGKSDVYSLGIILLEMLEGTVRRETVDDWIQYLNQLLIREENEGIDRYDEFKKDMFVIPDDLPGDMKDTLSAMIEPDPKKRVSLEDAIWIVDRIWISYNSSSRMVVNQEDKINGFITGNNLASFPIHYIIQEMKNVLELRKVDNLKSEDFIEGFVEGLRIKALYDCHTPDEILDKVGKIYEQASRIEKRITSFMDNLPNAQKRQVRYSIENFIHKIRLAKSDGNLDNILLLINKTEEKLRKLSLRCIAQSSLQHNVMSTIIQNQYEFQNLENEHGKLCTLLIEYDNANIVSKKRTHTSDRIKEMNIKSMISLEQYALLLKLEYNAIPIKKTSDLFKKPSKLQLILQEALSNLPTPTDHVSEIEQAKIYCVFSLLQYAHEKEASGRQLDNIPIAGKIAYQLHAIDVNNTQSVIAFIEDAKNKMGENGVNSNSRLFSIINEFQDTFKMLVPTDTIPANKI